MNSTFYLYLASPLKETQFLVEKALLSFEESLNEESMQDYLLTREKQLLEISSISVFTKLDELTLDDLQINEADQNFFLRVKSTIALEQMPYLVTNPLQVLWLENLWHHLPDFLFDYHPVHSLLTKEKAQLWLAQFSRPKLEPKPKSAIENRAKVHAPVEPLDFTLRDIYLEVKRLKENSLTHSFTAGLEGQHPKLQNLFNLTMIQEDSTQSLLFKSKLHPKEFGDLLEKLKMRLKNHR